MTISCETSVRTCWLRSVDPDSISILQVSRLESMTEKPDR